jgi:hypothetical protein
MEFSQDSELPFTEEEARVFEEQTESEYSAEPEGSIAGEQMDIGYEEPTEQEPYDSEKIVTEKIDTINFLKAKGVTKAYNLDTDIKVLRYEKMRIEREQLLSGQVSYSRHLMFFSMVSLEQLSNSFIDDSMEGFSAYLQRDIYSGAFDDNLQELCQKYGSSIGGFGPELRLVFSIVMSAVSFKTAKAANIPPPKTNNAPVQSQSQQQQFSQPQIPKKQGSTANELYEKYLQELKA